MISKELLSEVLGKEYDVKHITIQGTTVWYDNYESCTINIYELAHLCKEWALKYNILIIAYKHDFAVAKISNNITGKRVSDSMFSSDTEPEAIFKACQWILKEINETSKR